MYTSYFISSWKNEFSKSICWVFHPLCNYIVIINLTVLQYTTGAYLSIKSIHFSCRSPLTQNIALNFHFLPSVNFLILNYHVVGMIFTPSGTLDIEISSHVLLLYNFYFRFHGLFEILSMFTNHFLMIIRSIRVIYEWFELLYNNHSLS